MKGLIKRLAGIGPILPGTLETRQRPLKDVERRRRKDAGTFHVLSYSVKGHNSSMYVKQADHAAVAGMVANYGQARALIIELGLETLSACREKGVGHAVAAWREGMEELTPKEDLRAGVARRLRVLERSRDTWKASSARRAKELARQKVTIRDQRASLDKWRAEALAARRGAKANAKDMKKLKSEVEALRQRSLADSKKKAREPG